MRSFAHTKSKIIFLTINNLIVLREQYPLTLAASIILGSFAVIIFFVTTGIEENKSSEDETINTFQNFYNDTSTKVKNTKLKTQKELKQFLNVTQDKINESQELQNFQQLIEDTVGPNKTNAEN